AGHPRGQRLAADDEAARPLPRTDRRAPPRAGLDRRRFERVRPQGDGQPAAGRAAVVGGSAGGAAGQEGQEAADAGGPRTERRGQVNRTWLSVLCLLSSVLY